MTQDFYYKVDDRTIVANPGDLEQTLVFSVDHWIALATQSIADHGFFAVALSGGSTPKKIYKRLSAPEISSRVDWSKVYLFWSDERSVPPTNSESNFHMAMEEGGLSKLPLVKNHIFRMVAEEHIEENAKAYEDIILEKLNGHAFDLVMLGMGPDGHTASLFPNTSALKVTDKMVVANFIPQMKTWRMSFTFRCINAARHICVYVMGADKAETLYQVFTTPEDTLQYPVRHVGTKEHPVLWIADEKALHLLRGNLYSL